MVLSYDRIQDKLKCGSFHSRDHLVMETNFINDEKHKIMFGWACELLQHAYLVFGVNHALKNFKSEYRIDNSILFTIAQAIINDCCPEEDKLKRFFEFQVQLQRRRVDLGKLVALDNFLSLEIIYFLLGMPSVKCDSETTAKNEEAEFEKLYYDFLDGKILYDNFIQRAKELVDIIAENTDQAWDYDLN